MASLTWFALSREVPPGEGDYGSTFKTVQFRTTPERAMTIARQYAQDNPQRHVQLFRGRGLGKLIWDSADEQCDRLAHSPSCSLVGGLPTVPADYQPRKLPAHEHQPHPGPSRPEWWLEPLR